MLFAEGKGEAELARLFFCRNPLELLKQPWAS